MELTFEAARPDSVPDIVRLMRDFAEFEKLADYCTVTEEKLHEVMFGERADVRGIVARIEADVVAYALFYRSFASFRGQRGYFLEDLFIHDTCRGKGIGARMLKEVAKAARDDGAQRLDFQVLGWNEPAISFYESFGALKADDELHFKFTDAAFDDLAS